MSAIDDLYVRIGERIRQAREEQGWTQAQMGEAVGFSQATVAHYELGRRHIKLDDLYRIAAVLNKPYAYFLGVDTQVEQETRLSLERQLRRDVADFVGVRMLPVITRPVSIEEALTEDLIETRMPLPRELAAQADCIFEVQAPGAGGLLAKGDYLFIGRQAPVSGGRVYVGQVGDELLFLVRSASGQYSPLAGQTASGEAATIVGEFCGLYTRELRAHLSPGPGLGAVPLWDRLDPQEQEQLRKFAEFLLSQRST